jgi:hypothetical protein
MVSGEGGTAVLARVDQWTHLRIAIYAFLECHGVFVSGFLTEGLE